MHPRLLLPLLLIATASGCTVVAPDHGRKAVPIDKPWRFGHTGVRLDDAGDSGRS